MDFDVKKWLLANGFKAHGANKFVGEKCSVFLTNRKISITFGGMINNVNNASDMMHNLMELNLI